jgi:hypothetical protein
VGLLAEEVFQGEVLGVLDLNWGQCAPSVSCLLSWLPGAGGAGVETSRIGCGLGPRNLLAAVGALNGRAWSSRAVRLGECTTGAAEGNPGSPS